MGITSWVIAALVAWVLTAPDPITASIRSGTAGAIGSGTHAVAQSIAGDVRSAAAKRSAAHQDRVDRWKKDAEGGSRLARLKLKLDRVFGRGGVVESAGRRIGTHGQAAVEAGRVGWRESRTRGQRGLPAPIRSRLAGQFPALKKLRDAFVVALALDEIASPASNQTAQSSASGGDNKEAAVAPQNGKKNWAEITGTPTLRGEAKELDGEIAGAEQHLKVLNGWLDSIQERYATADIGTKHIGTAVQAAVAARPGVEQGMKALVTLSEAFAQLRKGLDAADQIGETAAQQDAKGDVKGYQAA